jgi:hypothetical protein
VETVRSRHHARDLRTATGFLLDTTARRGGTGGSIEEDKAMTVLRSALLFALAAGWAGPTLAV